MVLAAIARQNEKNIWKTVYYQKSLIFSEMSKENTVKSAETFVAVVKQIAFGSVSDCVSFYVAKFGASWIWEVLKVELWRKWSYG